MSLFLLRCVTKNMGGGGSKCGALGNVDEKIEKALIDIAIPKTEWGYRCFDVPPVA